MLETAGGTPKFHQEIPGNVIRSKAWLPRTTTARMEDVETLLKKHPNLCIKKNDDGKCKVHSFLHELYNVSVVLHA
jgi:hypothetical protein